MGHSVLAPAIASALAAFAASADSGKPLRMAIDPCVTHGPVKPVNGVGQPPMVGQLRNWSMMHYLKEAGIPFSRLHDVGGWMGHGLYADIPNLFPDFDADENDPANYRFAFTDSLIDALVEAGVEPFFRLGVTIENWVSWPGGLPRQRIEPPKDFSKWARICEHVIRHYTEGWANGRHHQISHWEIWNEPDGFEDPEKNGMWHGSFADYCRLYETAARHLKAAFPHLKIGGFGSCGVGKVSCKNGNERDEYHLKCFHEFLAFVRDRDCPLDFLSFHSYSKPEEVRIEIEYVREQLDKAGLAGVETCLDEWLPAPTHDKLGTARQAAEIAAALTVFQNGPLDSAAIYDARCGLGDYSSLFNPLTYRPHKAYYAFMAFNELRKRGTAVEIRECGAPRSPSRQDESRAVYAAAAKGADGSLAVMVANPGDAAVPFELEIAGDGRLATASECRITDDDRTDAEIPLPDRLPPHSFLVAIFRQCLQARAEILWTKPLCKESGRYIGWPTVGKAPNGDLLAVFSGDRDAHICPWGKVQMVRSADGGKTWSAPETICNSSIDDRDAGILLLDDGTLLLSWFTSVAYRSAIRDRAKLDPASRQWQWLLHDETISPELEKEQLGAFTRRSTDGGRTWEPPVRTPCSSPHGPIQLRDGRLLYVGKSGDADHADLGPGVGKIVAAESTDRGRSWRLIGEVPFPEGVNVLRMCHEPHAVETDDGRIVAQIRYECPWMPDGPHESIQTESADGGRTWSEPRPVGLDGFPPHLLRLADGTLLSVFGRRTGELGEYACLSGDQGRTWDVANEIRLAGHWSADIGYPSSVQLPDGTILTAYYQSEREGEPPCLMGTLWRVRPPADASTPDPGFSISEGKDWVRLDFHKDVEPGSALDFSGQGFQDAPAGKHGWLKAVGGHFEFEGLPGVEQRFYGVNLCGTANFPDHELAGLLADRLARAGYNAVRIHHHDRAWAKAFAARQQADDNKGGCGGSGARPSSFVDEIDRLDYFLARCFERGIYATTDLYVSRPVTWREIGIDRDGEIEENMLYKHYVGIHDGAFSNWCGFAKAFLEHVNPYTGRACKDEPGMPLISLVNESALYIAWKGARKAEDPVIRAAWEECRKELSSGREGASALPEEPPARGPEDPSDAHYLFEHWLGRRTWERCSAFVRSLGCRALLTNENNGRWHGEGEGNTSLFDYVDTHFYVDHPEFLERPWRLPSRCPNENPIRAGRPEIFGWGWAKGASKPYAISEWNLSSPGRYRAMGGILTGTLAAEQEWDGLWRFAYSHYAGNLPEGGELKGNRYFDCALDPLIAASDYASVCLFLGGDTNEAASRPALRLDKERGSMSLATARLCGGFAESGRIDAGPLSFEIVEKERPNVGADRCRHDVPTTIWASSIDGRPLASSSRILLVHLTDVQGDGARFADDTRQVLLDWGGAPLVEVGAADVELRLAPCGEAAGGTRGEASPRPLSVFALDTAGRRVSEIPSRVENGALRFRVCTAGEEGGRIYYEISSNLTK